MITTAERSNATQYAIADLASIEWADWLGFFSHLAATDIRHRFGHLVSAEAGLRLITLPNRHGSAIFGAFDGDALVGVANLAKDDTGQAEVALLVRSDRKRQGIGQALLRTALCQATREGLPVYGLVQPSNAAIIGLMRRLGFVHGSWRADHTIMQWYPDGTHEAVGSWHMRPGPLVWHKPPAARPVLRVDSDARGFAAGTLANVGDSVQGQMHLSASIYGSLSESCCLQ